MGSNVLWARLEKRVSALKPAETQLMDDHLFPLFLRYRRTGTDLCSDRFFLGSCTWPDSEHGEHAGTISHQVEHILCPSVGTIGKLHQFRIETSQTILFHGRQFSGLQNLSYFSWHHLLEMWKIPKKLQLECYAYLDRTHMFQCLGCVRNKQPCLTALLNQKLFFFWTQIGEWRAFQQTVVGLCFGNFFACRCWKKPQGSFIVSFH